MEKSPTHFVLANFRTGASTATPLHVQNTPQCSCATCRGASLTVRPPQPFDEAVAVAHYERLRAHRDSATTQADQEMFHARAETVWRLIELHRRERTREARARVANMKIEGIIDER